MRRSLLLFIGAAFIFSLPSCTKDEEDECEKTKWEQTINYNVQAKLKAAQAHLPDDRILKEATNMECIVHIYKIHCGGFQGPTMSATTNHDPRAISEDNWLYGFYIGKILGFDFDNDKDYLTLSGSITATFEDGSQYKTNSMSVPVTAPPWAHDWTRDYFYVNIQSTAVWERIN